MDGLSALQTSLRKTPIHNNRKHTMSNAQSAALALSIVGLILLARALGITRRSYRESLTALLDAIYVRRGLLSWELLVAAKGKEAGITQGRSLLPAAKAKAAKIGTGQKTII